MGRSCVRLWTPRPATAPIVDMASPELTREHVVLALKAAAGRWAIGPDGPTEVNRNRLHAELVATGVVCPFLDPERRPGKSRWGLTDKGVRWLTAQIGEVVTEWSRRFGSMQDPAMAAPSVAEELQRRFGYPVPPIVFMSYDVRGRPFRPESVASRYLAYMKTTRR
jgi:hypothetical protein